MADAIARIIVVAHAPGDDVGGREGRMSVGGEDANATPDAAMIVGGDDDGILPPLSYPDATDLDDDNSAGERPVGKRGQH